VELTLETVEAEHLFGDIPALAGRLWDVYTETLARGHPDYLPAPQIEIVAERLL
jgi:hypothetical protein